MIKIRDLHKAFEEKVILDGISVDIQDGMTHCIIGKSGTGKSVLLKLIVGLIPIDKGSVEIDGKPISELGRRELFDIRRKIGYVFQGAALFDSMNVYENVVIGEYENGNREEEYLLDQAQKTLSAVGLLPDYEERETPYFQKEWEILKNKKPSDLSGGMKKRVGVARALVGQPKYIFYDEPTTGLDPVTSEQIDNLIEELEEKMKFTSIVITHDMFSVYKIAEHIIMLDAGKIVFEGNKEQLINSSNPTVQEFLKRYE